MKLFDSRQGFIRSSVYGTYGRRGHKKDRPKSHYGNLERVLCPPGDEKPLKVYRPPIRSSDLTEPCRRRFLFRRRLALQPVGEHVRPLYVGSMFHDGMSEILQGVSLERTLRRLRGKFNKQKKKLEEEADSRTGLLPWGQALDTRLKELEEDMQLARVLVAVYAEAYPFDPDEWEVLHVEEIFTAKFEGLVSPCIAKADAILQKRATGGLWLGDHKTTGSTPLQYASDLLLAIQPRHYRLVAEAWGARPIAGVIHNIIQKPTIYCCGKDDFKFENYLKRCVKWYRDKEESGPENRPFLRSEVTFHEPVLSLDLRYRLQEQSRLANCWLNLEQFPTNEKECGGSFGKSRCPFAALCHTSPDGWKPLIDRFFVQYSREEEEEAQSSREGEERGGPTTKGGRAA